jgi:hypothetical protein
MLYLRELQSIGSAIHYKNRFLKQKLNPRERLIGLLLYKGCKLSMSLIVNKMYLNFLHKYHKLNIDAKVSGSLQFDLYNFDEFDKLYKSCLVFRDLPRALT